VQESSDAICYPSFMLTNCWSEMFSWAMCCYRWFTNNHHMSLCYACRLFIVAVNLLQGRDVSVYLQVLYETADSM